MPLPSLQLVRIHHPGNIGLQTPVPLLALLKSLLGLPAGSETFLHPVKQMVNRLGQGV